MSLRDELIERVKKTWGLMPAASISTNNDAAAAVDSLNVVALVEALEKCRQACLFDEDNGQTGVTCDPHISLELFDQICAVLSTIKQGE